MPSYLLSTSKSFLAFAPTNVLLKVKERANRDKSTTRMDTIDRVAKMLIEHLDGLCSAWLDFMKPHGDCDYLRDIDDPVSAQALHDIESSFRELELLLKRIISANNAVKRMRSSVSFNIDSQVILLTPPQLESQILHSNNDTTTLITVGLRKMPPLKFN